MSESFHDFVANRLVYKSAVKRLTQQDDGTDDEDFAKGIESVATFLDEFHSALCSQGGDFFSKELLDRVESAQVLALCKRDQTPAPRHQHTCKQSAAL